MSIWVFLRVLVIAAGDVNAQSSNRGPATATTSAPDSVTALTAGAVITNTHTDGMTVVSTVGGGYVTLPAEGGLSPTSSRNFASLTEAAPSIPTAPEPYPCVQCFLEAGASDNDDPISTIIFTSALITSQYSSGKQCLTSVDNYTQVTPYFTAIRSLSIGYAQFLSEAPFSFATFISQIGCDATIAFTSTIEGSNLVPVINVTEAPAFYPGTVLSLGTQTSPVASAIATTTTPQDTGSQAPSPTTGRPKVPLSTGVKIGIAFAAFGATMITVLVVAIGYSRRRRLKKGSSPSESDQPYFQQKGELEAKEAVKFELHAESRQNELDGEGEIHEMPPTKADPDEQAFPRQELRGEEHCKELG